MTKFNGVTVIQRGNRPSPIIPAKLDFLNYIAGELSDPYQVCSVHIFPNTAFGTADPYVNQDAEDANYGLVNSQNTNMVFHNYHRDGEGNRDGFNGDIVACAAETSYTGELRLSASSIFKEAEGQFSVILQPSGAYYPTSSTTDWDDRRHNTASGAGGYIDIWTVVQAQGSRPQIYVNSFGMNTANTFVTTEPLLVTTRNKLTQRYVEVGSRKKLQIKTELTVDNEPIKESLRNLLEAGALIQNPEISITKINESPQLTSRVQVTGAQTDNDPFSPFISDGVGLDSHGTISFVWDTSDISPFFESDILGGARGIYEVQVRFQLIDETILSPRFKLVVR